MHTTTAIYCKTTKGMEEIAHRSHHLASRLRSTLILIDGRTPWKELQKTLMAGADLDVAVQTLIDEGYVMAINP